MTKILEVSRWLFTPFIVFIFLLIVSLLALVVFGANEIIIKVLGYIFQLLGILYTILALNQSKIAFNYPGMKKRIKEWFCESPLWYKKYSCGSASATAINSGRANGCRKYTSCDKSIDGRLDSLEKYVDYIMNRVVDGENDIFRYVDGVKVALKKEIFCVNTNVSGLNDKLKENSVGAVSFVEAGLCSILVSSLSLSFPGEIASFLSK